MKSDRGHHKTDLHASMTGRNLSSCGAGDGDFVDSSRTITINLIFTGKVPPDLAALIRDAILAAESASGAPPVKVLRRRAKSPPRHPPQNRP